MAEFTVGIEFTVEADYMEMMQAVIDMDETEWRQLATALLARGKGVKITVYPE